MYKQLPNSSYKWVMLKIMIFNLNVKWSRYRPGVAQRMGRGIALLFHDRGTRRGWVVSSTSRPHFTPGKDLVLILQDAGWAPGPVWTGGKSRPHRHSIPDRPTRIVSRYTDWTIRHTMIFKLIKVIYCGGGKEEKLNKIIWFKNKSEKSLV